MKLSQDNSPGIFNELTWSEKARHSQLISKKQACTISWLSAMEILAGNRWFLIKKATHHIKVFEPFKKPLNWQIWLSI